MKVCYMNRDAALKFLDLEDESTSDEARAIEEDEGWTEDTLPGEGTLRGRIARHLRKWLPPGSSQAVTIPLSDEEYAELVEKLGGELEHVPRRRAYD